MKFLLCPLCHSDDNQLYCRDVRRDYLHCRCCDLVFVPPADQLSPVAEKAQYDLHCNDPADERYRAFLGRLFEPLRLLLPATACGLDYGSGPGPTLSGMLAECGHAMALYDPFYAPDPTVLRRTYDFITCTEVAEHFRQPLEEFERLWSLLRPGGILGLMTRLREAGQDFAGWYYKKDPTHICFYSRTSFAWLARQFGARLELHGADVILLHRP
ncbi:MAG: class I SAM-dependent methyltransferase [Desulfuromonas sp.]|jgi:hypothetical protein|nr:class I SAM-dependent methyltransferase [Desulfuromonas thiophila]MDY0397115.1 class I SAM-dependent methyltransferase [Desulfuromonas thiophila]